MNAQAGAVRIAKAGTDEWHHARTQGVGASEIAQVVGVSPYGTPLHLYLKKRGELPREPENDAMRWGRILEPVVADELARVVGQPVVTGVDEQELLQHREFPRILATPDLMFESGELGECKTTNWRRAAELGPTGTDEIPVDWLLQCQQQMSVVGASVCWVGVLIDGSDFRCYRVDAHPRLQQRIADIVEKFWFCVENAIAPAPNWEHPLTADLVLQMHKVEIGKTVNLGAAALDLFAELDEINQNLRTWERAKKLIKAKIAEMMGNAEWGVLPGGTHAARRQTIQRSGYTVEPSEYTTLAKRKYKPGESQTPPPAE